MADAVAGRTIEDTWWVINGQVLLDALVACRQGADPQLMYVELHANSVDRDDDDEPKDVTP